MVEKGKDDRVKFLEDRLIFDYGKLSRIYKEPDIPSRKEVQYKDIPNLKIEPEELISNAECRQGRIQIYVPEVDKTIVFIHETSIERWGNPPDEFIYGPYLAREEN